MAVFNGENTRTALIPESTYGTNPATGAQELFADSYEIGYDPGFVYNQTLVDTSPSFLTLGNEGTTWGMVHKLYKSNLAFHIMLNRLFMSLSTSGGADPYTHLYTQVYATNPGSFTLEVVPNGEAASTSAMQVKGCVPTSMTISAPAGEQPTVEWSGIGREYTREASPGTAYTSSVDTAIFVPGDLTSETISGATTSSGLKLTAGGTEYGVKPISYDVTYEAGIDESGYTLDNRYRISPHRGGLLAVSGNLDFYLEEGTRAAQNVIALIRSGTPFSFHQWFSTGTPASAGYKSFDFHLGYGSPSVIFDPEGAVINVDGPGAVTISAPFQVLNVESSVRLTVSNEKNGTAVNI